MRVSGPSIHFRLGLHLGSWTGEGIDGSCVSGTTALLSLQYDRVHYLAGNEDYVAFFKAPGRN